MCSFCSFSVNEGDTLKNALYTKLKSRESERRGLYPHKNQWFGCRSTIYK